jgi:hypothetical protein
VHAVPDLRIAGGRLGDVLGDVFYHGLLLATEDLRVTFLCPKQVDIRGSWCQINYVRRPLPCHKYEVTTMK